MTRFAILPCLLILTGLSSCGLRGDLERPDPLWGDPPPVTEESKADEPAAFAETELRPRTDEVRVATSSYRDPDTGNIVWVQNENGGDTPLAAPTTEIDVTSLPPVSE